jgi:hypothetical protein
MEILGAAAILAVALVAVAVLFGRGGRRAASGPPAAGAAQAGPVEREEKIAEADDRLRDRASELDRRARELDEQTRALEAEREQLALRERDQEAALERIAGLSAAQA